MLSTHLICLHVCILSSLRISFSSVGNDRVATDFFYKLVFNARLFMNKASWGCCVLVFDSFGEPAVHPETGVSCAPDCSGTEFEVGCTTSCEEDVGATVKSPMDYESSMG